MKVGEAAELWLDMKPKLRELQRQVEAAEDVLKEHFRTRGTTNYKRLIAYSSSTYRRLDVRLARAELGPRVAACEVEATRETLSAL